MKPAQLWRDLAFAGALTLLPVAAGAQPVHDGSHDFDFAPGVWHTHITTVDDPFSGGTHTATSDGTKTARPIWGGRAVFEELDVDGPDGHWDGATLFTYDPKSGQWTQTYISGEDGSVEAPSVGEFKNGRGEFYGTDTYKGKKVLMRGIWSDITPTSHRYEIDYSQDGGQTWGAVFKAYLTRLK